MKTEDLIKWAEQIHNENLLDWENQTIKINDQLYKFEPVCFSQNGPSDTPQYRMNFEIIVEQSRIFGLVERFWIDNGPGSRTIITSIEGGE